MKKSSLTIAMLIFSAASTHAQSSAPRVYITDNKSWFVAGSAGFSGGNGGAVMAGGSISDTMPLIQHFAKECPGVIVSQNKDAADYVVLFEGNHTRKAQNSNFGLVGAIANLSAKYDQIAVFRGNGDILFTGNTRHLKNAVKDACNSVMSAPLMAHVAPVPAPTTQTIVVRVESGTPIAATVAAVPVASTPIPATATAPAVGLTGTTASGQAQSVDAQPSLGEVARQNRARKAQEAQAQTQTQDQNPPRQQ